MKLLVILLSATTFLFSCVSTKKDSTSAQYGASVKGAQKVELLSTHRTKATYKGLEYRLCRGLTALCPNKCGESGEFAIFEIQEYLDYQKSGEYGDGKQKNFMIHVTDYDKKPLNNKYSKNIVGLKVDDTVYLDWDHIYVTKDNSSYPERPLLRLAAAE
ncbi:MAG: hypothetical protein ACRC4W_05360 [Treponemataceae bacterium]